LVPSILDKGCSACADTWGCVTGVIPAHRNETRRGIRA
jgi:hypothetical protein